MYIIYEYEWFNKYYAHGVETIWKIKMPRMTL